MTYKLSKKRFPLSLLFSIIVIGLALIATLILVKSNADIRSKAANQRNGQTTFADVPVNHWAFAAIERIYSLKFTTGCATNPLRFCPDQPVTRKAAAAFLIRAIHGANFTPPTSSTPIFSDVNINEPFRGYIEQFYRDGLTTGCGDNPLRFCPNDTLTRSAMATFFVRAIHGAKYTPPTATGTLLSDVSKSTQFAAEIEQLYRDGYTNTLWPGGVQEQSVGCEGTGHVFCPNKPATRATMAVMLTRLYDGPPVFSDVPPNYVFYSSIQRVFNAHITTGCGTNPLRFCPNDPITRGAAAALLMRAKYGSGYAPQVNAQPIFTDVPASHPFRGYIEQMFRDGITTGCGTNPLRFCPDDQLTRAAAAVFIIRLRYGQSYVPDAATGYIFTDVQKDTQFASFIEKFFGDSLTVGCNPSPFKFCPSDPATRGAFAVFLDRSFDLR